MSYYLLEEHIASLITNCRINGIGGKKRHPTGFKTALTTLLDCLEMIKREYENQLDISEIERKIKASVAIDGEEFYTESLSNKDSRKIAEEIIKNHF